MRVPKKIKTYCPRCNTHTEHTVTIYKHGKRRALAEGERRYRRKQKGYGSKRKPEQKELAKVNKRVTLRIACSKCGYKRHILNQRLKKVELVEVSR